jgi:glycosyltransferase involved in cell wall biosynthesis
MSPPLVVIDSAAEVGGAELSLLPVIERLAAERRVVVLFPGEGPLEAAATAAGATVEPGFRLPASLDAVSGSYGGPGLHAVVDGAAQQARLVRTLRRLRPSLVYCNGFRAQVAATIPARLAGARAAWHVRDFARPGALGRAWSGLSRLTSLVLANSAATAAQPGLGAIRSRVRVAHPGVDRGIFTARDGEPNGPQTIGMAAHLTPWKGHLRFLDLFATLRAELPELRARIAGGSIYRTAGHDEFAHRVRSEIDRRGLGDACSLEPVAHSDMPAWLASLHLLVHCPLRPEPFGRALAEALAVGVPVVSASGGGAPEVLGDAGLLVTPGDDAQLRRSVERLLRDPEQRAALASPGPARAARLFDQEERAAAVTRDLVALA